MHHANPIAFLDRLGAIPLPRRLLGALLAPAPLRLGSRVTEVDARKRKKRRRQKPTPTPTCDESCAAYPACSTCYQRPGLSPLCGGPGSALCEGCSSDSDCVGTGRPYCTRRFTDRATGETFGWGCPGDPIGVCTNVGACEA